MIDLGPVRLLFRNYTLNYVRCRCSALANGMKIAKWDQMLSD